MTESSITDDPTTDAVLDFDAWLSGAGLAQGSVEILQKPALLAKWDDLRRRYERAQQTAKGEGGIADDNPLTELESEAEALMSEIEASRTVLHVRALIPDDLSAILAAHPVTPGPQFRGKIPSVQPNPTETQAKAFLGMWQACTLQKEQWEADNAAAIDAHRQSVMDALEAQGAEKISRAVASVEQGGRVVASHITVEQVLKLARAIGNPQVSKIIAEIDRLSESAPEVPASFLSRNSAGDLS